VYNFVCNSCVTSDCGLSHLYKEYVTTELRLTLFSIMHIVFALQTVITAIILSYNIHRIN